MKAIFCVKCGDEIESGYAINPEVSAICNTCYAEEEENLKIELGLEKDKNIIRFPNKQKIDEKRK